MKDRKPKNQQRVTRKLRTAIRRYQQETGEHEPTKELNRRTVLVILISEQLATEKVDKNQESSILVRLNLTESSDYLISDRQRTQKVDREQEIHKQKNTIGTTKNLNGTVSGTIN